MSKETNRLNATKIGEELNILPKRGAGKIVNDALKLAGYLIEDDKGYHLSDKAHFVKDGETIPFGEERKRAGKSYIVWNRATMKNKLFLKKLAELTSKKEVSSKKISPKKISPKKTSPKKKSMEEFKKSEAYNPSRDGAFNKLQDQIAVARYLKDWDKVKELEAKVIPILRTVQGFEVRSMGECRIMDALTERYNLKVYSERQLDSDAVVYSDFFMKFRTAEFGLVEIWIELWAKKLKEGEEPKNSFEKSYIKRRVEKEDIYEKEGVILVNLEYSELMYDLDAQLLRAFNAHPALKKMGMKILDLRDSEMEFIKKFDR